MIFKSNSFSKNSNIHHAFFSRKNGASKGIYGSLNCGLGSKDKKKHVYQNIEIVKKKIKTKFLFLLHQPVALAGSVKKLKCPSSYLPP